MTKRKTTKRHLTDDVFNFLHAIPHTLAKVLTEKTFFTIMSRLSFGDHFLYYSHLLVKLNAGHSYGFKR